MGFRLFVGLGLFGFVVGSLFGGTLVVGLLVLDVCFLFVLE